MKAPLNPTQRRYNTISPSAKALLFMKGYTQIPYARQVAELMAYPGVYDPDFSIRDMGFWARVMHFENRYWSIDQLMAASRINNILEISAGFSFRGLAMAKEHPVYYIDTDLPELMATKKELAQALQNDSAGMPGKLDLLPLNALDENAFDTMIHRFPLGEIAIVNEGLLMYLEQEEKEKLCRIIHKVLTERGGFWITADIYVKKQLGNLHPSLKEREKQFFAYHRIEEKKFNNFEEAEALFNHAGLVIDQEANPDHAKLSTLPYLMSCVPEGHWEGKATAGGMRKTWRLCVAKK